MESQALTVLLDQMAAHYPHQEFPDATGDIWREAIERLAVKFTLKQVRDVLADFLIKPGQKFFPHPSEIAEALEELIVNERNRFLTDHPISDCSICDNQRMVVVRRSDGGFVAVDCECKKAWKRSAQRQASQEVR